MRGREKRCIEGLAFVRRVAFNPVADSGLGIWTLGCVLKRDRKKIERASTRERERDRGLERGRGRENAQYRKGRRQ